MGGFASVRAMADPSGLPRQRAAVRGGALLDRLLLGDRGLAAVLPHREESDLTPEVDDVDDRDDDVADGLLRDVERQVLEDRQGAVRARAEDVRGRAPEELVVRPEEPLGRHGLVAPKHQEEVVGGAEHGLAPGDGRARGTPLRHPDHAPHQPDRDEHGPYEWDHTTSFVIFLTMTVPGSTARRAPVRA